VNNEVNVGQKFAHSPFVSFKLPAAELQATEFRAKNFFKKNNCQQLLKRTETGPGKDC